MSKKNNQIYHFFLWKKKKQNSVNILHFSKILRWREIKADSNWQFCMDGQYSRS